MVGQVVKKISALTNKAIELQITQPAGIYFINATTSGGTYVVKVEVMAQ